MSKNVIFMIEGGKALEMVKQHISDRSRVWKKVRKLAKELGVESIYTDRMTGVLNGASFPGPIHPEFSKRKNGISFPKKGTSWHARLKAQKGYRNPIEWISSEFGIPCSLSYKTKDGGWGTTCIGSMLTECGFLYLSEQGPYAMWAPDVPTIVGEYTAKGLTVEQPAASFKFEIDGCRRVESEEWEILVLQHNLNEKRAA